ncbi:phage minor head protein [Pantoea latae]|uniref:phage minor head protein n=1 Tax=Pantoea latae TaxID=1964541 RepID=UPI00117C93BB|nr:phage minor head protein [Pantoea latae]
MEPGVILIAFVIALVLYKAAKKRRIKKEDNFLSNYGRRRRIAYPKARHPNGRRKTPYEREQDIEAYLRDLAQAGRDAAKAEEIKQKRLGVTHYIWRSAEDADTCEECKKNNGKKFSWNRPPKTGRPGEGRCCPRNLCRCYPEAILK